jgi:hypothetical protein
LFECRHCSLRARAGVLPAHRARPTGVMRALTIDLLSGCLSLAITCRPFPANCYGCRRRSIFTRRCIYGQSNARSHMG